MSGFVHLHTHTEYSLLDGACRISNLPKKAAELGQKAIAITDHGVMFGAINFYRACIKEGIKPIIGCEVYVAPRERTQKEHGIDNSPYHLILLCENNEGYSNLIKLVSLAYTEGFYNKPRVDRELLKKYSDGLICLSACLAGEIPRKLLRGDYEGAKEAAIFYKDLFGKDNFFIEIQNHGIKEQEEIIPNLLRLADELDLGLVATNDAHYINKDDALMQKALVCVQTNHTIYEDTQMEFETEEFYIKSEEEMREIFPYAPSAIENTGLIAERCNVSFEFGVTKLPRFVAPNGQDNKDYFLKLCYEGFEKRYSPEEREKYKDRLLYEIDVITKMGYADYYLIVQDFIAFAKSSGIAVGPGRGSGAASIVAYCIGITGIDPMKYQLLFERFLNPERVSMPDFDIDFCFERRGEVIDYVIRKYGYDHVAQIVTFGTMAAKGAIRDIGRVLGMPYASVDKIAKLVPNELNMTIEKALSNSKELKDLYNADPEIKKLIDMAKKVEGMPRNMSTHAAGVVITDKEVADYVPLAKSDESVVTQFPMTTLEELGLLKMDFLGLRTLTVISKAEELIRKHTPDFSILDIPDNDAGVMEMLSSGQTQGVFQFESGGMRQVLTSMKPTTIEDLIAIISLYRPGPMDSIPQYIENRHNPDNIKYTTPLLKPILDVTYGCIVYQEQVMQICRSLSGYSYGRSDLVRRAMAKKKHDVMEKERQNFIYGKKNEDGSIECIGAVNNGVDEKAASDIFDQMESFASYAFNKAHAAAYAYVSYQTAYLKRYYKKEFFAALLTSVIDNASKVSGYIAECHRLGIKVLPADIRYSSLEFAVEGDGIRFGLLAIKNLGRNVINSIIAEREENGEFSSFYDFCKKAESFGLNKRALESLVKCGTFDYLNPNRRQLVDSIDPIFEYIVADKRRNLEGQMSLFGGGGAQQSGEFVYPNIQDYTYQERLNFEKEVTGLYLSGHPLDKYTDKIDTISPFLLKELQDASDEETLDNFDGRIVYLVAVLSDIKIKTLKSGGKMAIFKLEDLTGECEGVAFPLTLEKYADLIRENSSAVFKGRISVKDASTVSVLVDDVYEIDAFSIERMKRPQYAGMQKAAPKRETPKEVASKKAVGTIFLKAPKSEGFGIQRIKDIAKNHEGNFDLLIHFSEDNKTIKLSVDRGVELSLKMMKALSEIDGVEQIAITMAKD